MIQVNLLPGAASHSQRGEFDMGALLSSATAGIKDKYLLGAVGTATTVVLAVGLMFMSQGSRERTLTAREVKAMADSSQFKIVLEAKARAEATRDSLYQQVAIIKSIDDSRYLWPHLLEEISNALPQYTWLTSVQQTSAPPSSVASDSSAAKPGAAAKKKTDLKARKARADSVLAAASRATRFRIVGHTVDIQALTLFMKTLEASPFIRNVQLTRSDMAVSDGKEVTEFQLEAESQVPPQFLIKTVTTPGEAN
jgi:Tfp pilus assembly protein PilN